ncbi:phosphotransferase [Emticicia sp. SJ17W-69]|uniref:phosphotransferase n=1 Tax=Emticicia sp. SJ17W-69 TaxID=3421657 RepID=UPI003EB6EDAC
MLLSDNLNILKTYLHSKNWISENEEVIKAEKPGNGNMNFTLRVYISTGKTFIIKQSRDYVEKYPSIAAPVERAITEGKFYEFTQTNKKLHSFMPDIFGIDEVNNIIVTQDLGLANDFTNLYKSKQQISTDEITSIIEYLSELHRSFRSETPNPIFANRAMRALNHEHIFIYPLMEENGFDLDNILKGLQKVAMEYKTDRDFKNIVKNLGEVYLSDGNYLLHGDYYLGSFLRSNRGVKIIDPEFCFYGYAEFDLGVLIAHLKMSEQSQKTIELAITNYKKSDDFNEILLNQFIGVEIMRRIIGIAQLPLTLSLEKRVDLLKEAKSLITNA